MRHENRVAWELHFALVRKLDEDPGDIIKNALKQAGIMKDGRKDMISIGWMQLLRGDLEDRKAAMLDVGHDAEDLRQMSLFLRALSEAERRIAILMASISQS